MSEISLNTGVDYIYAQLHSWWSRSAHGSCLSELSSAATVVNFIHLLQRDGVISIRNSERVNQELLVRQYERLGKLGQLLGEPAREFMRVFQQRLALENVKILLNYRFFPEREGSPFEMMIPFKGDQYSLHAEYEDALNSTDTRQFIRLLPPMAHRERVVPIIEALDSDRNLMHAECALDILTFENELEALGKLPHSMRAVAREFLVLEIDLTNAITLCRNANLYHLPPEELSHAWVPGGTRIDRKHWLAFASAKSTAELIRSSAGRISSQLTLREGESINQLENRVYSQIQRRARALFYRADAPELAIPAYVWLLRFETTNLSRIYEGLRFSLPVRTIQSMLIQ